jgi:hypothetical protein
MEAIRTDWATLQVADGATMNAYVARPRASYNPAAAQQAWALTHALLKCYLGSWRSGTAQVTPSRRW